MAVELTTIDVSASPPVKALDTIARNHVWLHLEVDKQRMADKCREGVVRDGVETVCFGYSGLMRMHAEGCCSRQRPIFLNQ